MKRNERKGVRFQSTCKYIVHVHMAPATDCSPKARAHTQGQALLYLSWCLSGQLFSPSSLPPSPAGSSRGTGWLRAQSGRSGAALPAGPGGPPSLVQDGRRQTLQPGRGREREGGGEEEERERGETRGIKGGGVGEKEGGREAEGERESERVRE